MASSRYHTHVHPGPEGLALDARRILDDVLSALQGARKMNAPDAPDASALMAAIANEAMARIKKARRRSKHACSSIRRPASIATTVQLRARLRDRAAADHPEGRDPLRRLPSAHVADRRLSARRRQATLSRCAPARRSCRRRAGSAGPPTCRTCATTSRTCSMLLTGVPLMASSTSPGCTPARAAAPPRLLDHQAAVDAGLALLLRLRADAAPGPACPGWRRRRAARPRSPCRWHCPAVAVSSSRLPSRQTSSVTLSPARPADRGRQVARGDDGLAVDLADHVAGLAGRPGRPGRPSPHWPPARLRACRA